MQSLQSEALAKMQQAKFRSCCHSPAAPWQRSARRPQIRALKTDSTELLRVGSDFRRVYRVGKEESRSFGHYLADQLYERAQDYNLPLGASLRPNFGYKDELILQVPRVTLMDLYVHPTSHLRVEYGKDKVSFYTLETKLDGSHHVQSLHLNDRFDLDLEVHISIQGDLLVCHADFKLVVDVPFPFSVTPSAVLESVGNNAIKRVLSQLMDVLARSMVNDHKRWLQSESESESDYERPLLAGRAR